MTLRRIIRSSQFDSEIMPPDRSNRSDFIIKFRLHLIRRGTRAGTRPYFHDNNRRWRIEEWDDAEWVEFSNNVKNSVEQIFNRNRLFLMAPERVDHAFTSAARFHENTQPHLKCRLEITIEPGRDRAHGVFLCVKNPTSGNDDFRSFASRGRFHSSGLITNQDINTETVEEGGHRTRQCTVAHEFAHMLGVGHPGGANSNADWAYGRPGSEAWRSLSGSGNIVGPRELQAWRNRIIRHTDRRFGWRFVLTQEVIDSFLRPNMSPRNQLLGQ